jgi:hypothetical protein
MSSEKVNKFVFIFNIKKFRAIWQIFRRTGRSIKSAKFVAAERILLIYEALEGNFFLLYFIIFVIKL